MASAYQQIVALLDELDPGEMAVLIELLAQRLQRAIGLEEVPDEEEGGRRYLPRLPQMIRWGIVWPMKDRLFVRGAPDKPALLLDGSQVAYEGQAMPINDWAKLVTGWKSVSIYDWVVIERTGRTLGEMRQAYMEEHGIV